MKSFKEWYEEKNEAAPAVPPDYQKPSEEEMLKQAPIHLNNAIGELEYAMYALPPSLRAIKRMGERIEGELRELQREIVMRI